MAGGLGKRMNSEIPKVLHLVKGKPMLCYVLEKALEVGSEHILIVVGKYKAQIQKKIAKYFSVYEYFKFTFIDQAEPLGTGHAIQCCLPFFHEKKIDSINSHVLILSGDVPLIEKNTIQQLLQKPNTILITKLENPFGCGRIVFRENYIEKIIEEKDCTLEERKIQYVNAGIYHFTLDVLFKSLPKIKNENVNKEYYLTDIVEIAGNLSFYELPKEKQIEIININTPTELEFVNNSFQKNT
jgi:UDP-N-acetylglucosamine diphosphorylase/glucosamine-1-phosphate N-acetyltransferase